ncbi:MAG: TetR/AcrR family transcriptional regulator [Xanthomonadales bacterium]|nr:TetR/AcrR family transcriptional regulator [Xanthomonadales bacterium]
MKKEKSETKAAARIRAQKERVLAAAQACFVERGFHAASMATIASTARMSPGLIYRYFENKNAIILAIIEQQLTVARQRIRQLQSAENLSKRIFDYLDEKEPEDEKSISIPLYLEISAQATRDPQIAEALRRYDVTVRSELGDWLRRGRGDGGCGLPDDDVAERALMLLCLIEGLKLRAPRSPALDPRKLRKILDELLETLVSGPV